MTHTDHSSYVDDAGRLILLIPISNREGRFARIEAADYARLRADRRSLSFYVNDNGHGGNEKLRTAFLNAEGDRQNNAQVSRLVIQPRPGLRVYFLNGDRTDVRRSNLVLRPWGKQQKRAAAIKAGLLQPTA